MTSDGDNRRVVRNLRRGGGLLLCLLAAFALAFSWQSWQAERTEQLQHFSMLAELGEKGLDSYFSQLERALELLGRELIDKNGEFDARRAQSLLKPFIEVHAELADIALQRLDGQVLVTANLPRGAALPSAAQEPSFIQAREELLAGRTLSIARPLPGLMTNQWVIPFRLGIRDKRGSLAYIVTAVIPLSKPQSFWEHAPLPASAAAGLLRDDNYLVSRYPMPDGAELENIYGKPLTGVLSQHLRRERYPASGFVEGTGSLAGPERLFVFRRLSHHPLTFFVMTPLAHIRAQWWNKVWPAYLLMLILLAGGVAVYVWTLRRQLAWEAQRRRGEAQTREALAARERHLSLILDALPVRVAYFDAEQRYRFVNLSFEKWNGIPREEILGKTLREIRGEEAYLQRRPYLEATLSGRAQTAEDYFDFPGVGRRYVLISTIPDFASDGKVNGFFTVITDLTEGKEAHQRELETERALRDTLVREVHHRVKNTLQGTILLMDSHGHAHPELAAALEPAIARLNAMAAVFGLQAAGRSQPVVLGQLVAEICGLLAKAMACSIQPVIESDSAAAVQLAEDDSVPVALIVNELVFNAIKHGRPGEPVRVVLDGGGESVSVRVLNAGAVLPPGFDFASGAGLGTGLQLVKSMLTKEGAKVEITSGPEGVAATLLLRPPAIAPGSAAAP